MKNTYLEKIRAAQVYDVASKTPLEKQSNLSRRLGNTVMLKREDMQPVFSFKLRGAYNKMVRLSREQLARGVIASSAGNHAQGVALAAQKLRCRALIVMPTTTPQIKVDAVTRRGAEVMLHGDSYSDSYMVAQQLAHEKGLTFVHPYDDPDVIAGQGTIAMEILHDHPEPIHALFCCVGGGGLIAGVAAYVKAVRPEIRMIGVEAQDANAMRLSLQAGQRVILDQVGLFADGAAVKEVGEETFRLCQAYVDDIIEVDNDAICAAIKDVFEDTRSILEPAGALAVAGLKHYCATQGLQQQTLVAVASGANMNFDRLRFVSERAEIGEQREILLAVTIPERPGSFKTFCKLLGQRNITEFNYRYSDPAQAHIFVGISTAARERDTIQLLHTLQEHQLMAYDLTDNELGKLHIRHLVGGRAPHIKDELLYRFEFPERPGALMQFLEAMGQKNRNISLFHYRNHGSDYGRVLVGIQVPGHEKPEFERFLNQIGYPYWDESANPAYHFFLG